MQEPLVSSETAKLAKEVGFNIPQNKMYSFGCILLENHKSIKFHNGDKNECANIPHDWNNTISQTKTQYFSAPTQALLQQWLRDVHKIDVIVLPSTTKPNIYICTLFQHYTIDGKMIVDKVSVIDVMIDGKIGIWSKYENALETGLQEALKTIKDK